MSSIKISLVPPLTDGQIGFTVRVYGVEGGPSDTIVCGRFANIPKEHEEAAREVIHQVAEAFKMLAVKVEFTARARAKP